MQQVVVKGESVYECSVCGRKTRVPSNPKGLDVLSRCIITRECPGKLRRVTLTKEINETPAFPPEIPGVRDWFQRRVLYVHDQPVQSNTWRIHHNLGNRPQIHVFVNRTVDGEEQLTPMEAAQEIVIDANTIELIFVGAETGVAHCVALSSQNITNPYAIESAPTQALPFQVSSEVGEIALATLSSSSLVGLALTYRTSGSLMDVVIEYAGIDDVASVDTPWAGASKAIINGRVYTVRSFNITTTPLAPPYFAAGAVQQGSTFYVSNYNGQPPKAGECLILLGNPPYATVDRITDRYIDCADIDTNTPQLYYSSGKAFTDPSIIKTTYPHVLVV